MHDLPMQKGIACSAPLIMCIVLHLLAAGGALAIEADAVMVF